MVSVFPLATQKPDMCLGLSYKMYNGQTKNNPVFTRGIAQRPSLFSESENVFIQLIGKRIQTIP